MACYHLSYSYVWLSLDIILLWMITLKKVMLKEKKHSSHNVLLMLGWFLCINNTPRLSFFPPSWEFSEFYCMRCEQRTFHKKEKIFRKEKKTKKTNFVLFLNNLHHVHHYNNIIISLSFHHYSPLYSVLASNNSYFNLYTPLPFCTGIKYIKGFCSCEKITQWGSDYSTVFEEGFTSLPVLKIGLQITMVLSKVLWCSPDYAISMSVCWVWVFQLDQIETALSGRSVCGSWSRAI